MGLLNVPKKYNPPGKRTPMEYPALLNRGEMAMLKMHGGSGKKTKWGVPSFSYEDSHPGSDYGSREGGAQSGDTSGRSGNANGGSGNSRTSLFSALTRPKVALPNRWLTPVKPVAPVVAPPVAAPSIPMGMNFGSIPITPAIPSGMNFAPIGNYAGTAPAVNPSGTSTAFGGYPSGAINQTPVSGPPNRVDLNRATLAPWGGHPQQNSGNQDIANALTSQESPQYVMGAGANVPISRNAEMQVMRDLMDQGVGWQKNPYTQGANPTTKDMSFGSPTALDNLGKVLSGETIRGVGAAEVANSLINRARNPGIYPAKDAYNPRQLESLKSSDPAIAARMARDVPGSMNYDRALNNAINGLSNPATMNPAAINATDFQAKALANRNGNTGVNVGGNIFGNHYTQPTQMSSLGADFAGSGMTGANPVAPIQMASAVPTAGPPVQQTQTETGKSLWQTWAPQAAQDVAVQAQKVLVDMPAEKIAALGGFERAGKLAQIAVSISKYLPGGDGLAATSGQNHDRLGAVGDIMGNSPSVYSAGTSDTQPGRGLKRNQIVPPVAPAPPPSTSPSAPNWMYPQYTQAWANLPTGVGGPIWTPTPPADGIFDKPTDKKKKNKRGVLA